MLYFLLMLLKRSQIAREFTLNSGKLFSLLATFYQELPLSLLPGFTVENAFCSHLFQHNVIFGFGHN